MEINTMNTMDTEERNVSNNHVEVVGTISGGISYSHEVYMEKFFSFSVEIKRNSGVVDTIPCMVSERMLRTDFLRGARVELRGELRSYNSPEGKLQLFLFIREIEITQNEDKNEISLEGFICRPSTYRETPFGRQITDLLIAVNRRYNKSDYIPIIVWGRNAKYVEGLEVGTKICLKGRIQSRTYFKKYHDDKGNYICSVEKTAYEVSASMIGEA